MAAERAPRKREAILLQHRGIEALPIPTPLDLTDIPIVLSMLRLPERDAQGQLPESAYRTRHQVITADGRTIHIDVLGDPEIGLPHGYDLEVLVAVFRLIDEDRAFDGKLRDPSARRICEAMGKPYRSDQAKRIREALERFARVTIKIRETQEQEQYQFPMPLGARGRGVWRLEGNEIGGILSYKDQVLYERNIEGEYWIERLWVNEIWVQQALNRWAAWVDPTLMAALPGTLDKRLYHFLAGQAVRRGVSDDEEWVFNVAALRSALAIDSKLKLAQARDRIVASLRVHEEHEIVKGAKVEGGRGNYNIVLRPGRRLQIAAAMRGVGLQDLHDVRLQLNLLHYFGVTESVARELTESDPDQVYETLCYSIYLRERAPERIKSNWAGYIVKCIRERHSFAWDKDYIRWRKEPLQHVVPSEEEATLKGIESLPFTPSFEQCVVEEATADAIALWEKIRPEILERSPKASRGMLSHLAAHSIEGDCLVCVGTVEFFVRWTQEHCKDLVEAVLVNHSDSVRNWVVRLITSQR